MDLQTVKPLVMAGPLQRAGRPISTLSKRGEPWVKVRGTLGNVKHPLPDRHRLRSELR